MSALVLPQRADSTARIAAGIVAAACLALLVIGSWLTPAAAGHGTHQQLGLPPCGWYLATGRPCPTCGMTTAFAHACHLQLSDAIRTQPGGALFALGVSVGFWVALHMAITGSRLQRPLAKLLRPKTLWITAGVWALSWGYTLLTWKTP